MRSDVYGLARTGRAVEVRLARIAEGNDTVLHGKEGVVGPYVDVLAGKDLRTALADNDLTDANLVAVGTLNTQVFWV